MKSKTSILCEVWSQLKGEKPRCAGVVFFPEGEPHEGWCRLQANMATGEAAMGHIFVRIGAPLSTTSNSPQTESSIILEEVLPEFPAESEHKMDPEPDARLKSQQILSLAVSLCDVSRVRDFLLQGGSVRTPVIISRGVEGTPLEATCANCPATAKRKKMRIEYDGSAYSRLRGCEDAVAIAKLLLHCGAVHDARSVRWLYDNAAASQGKKALMRVLDAKLYPHNNSANKIKAKANPSRSPSSPLASSQERQATAWAAASKNPRRATPEVIQSKKGLLGGQRKQPGAAARSTRSPAEEEAYRQAQEALSRPITKPIPEEPLSDDDDLGAKEDAKDVAVPSTPTAAPVVKRSGHHGFADRPAGESSDLEESSSSTDEELRRRRAAAASKRAAKRAAPRAAPVVAPPPPSGITDSPPSATMDGGSTSMTDADGRSRYSNVPAPLDRLAEEQHQEETWDSADQQQHQEYEEDPEEDEQYPPQEIASIVERGGGGDISIHDLEGELNELTSVVEEEMGMDWGVIQTDASMIDLGEEIVSSDPVMPAVDIALADALAVPEEAPDARPVEERNGPDSDLPAPLAAYGNYMDDNNSDAEIVDVTAEL